MFIADMCNQLCNVIVGNARRLLPHNCADCVWKFAGQKKEAMQT